MSLVARIDDLNSSVNRVNEFGSLEELETGMHDCIRYYNCDRIKLKLKRLSPVDYCKKFGAI